MLHGTEYSQTRHTFVVFWAQGRQSEPDRATGGAEDSRTTADFSGLWGGGLSVLTVLLVVLPAWLIGGVGPNAQRGFFWIAMLAMFGCWCFSLTRSVSIRQLPVTLGIFVLAIVLVFLQTVPLNAGLHRTISPSTFGWWEQLSTSSAAGAGQIDSTSYSISLYPESTRRELYMLALAAAAFLLGAIVGADRIPMAIIGVAAAINGAALAFFGLVQQLTYDGRLFWSIPLSQGGAPFASYVNRNNAAGMLNMCLACAIAWMVWGLVHETHGLSHHRIPRRSPASDPLASSSWLAVARQRLLDLLAPLGNLNFSTTAGLIAAGCITAGVFSSLSRGGMVALIGASAVTLVAVALAGRWRHSWLGPVLLPVALGALLIDHAGRSDTVIDRAATLLDKQARDADGRWWLWSEAWDATSHLMPAGSGLGTFRYAFRLYQQQPSASWFYHAENIYVQTLVEAGAPGIALLVAGLVLVATACWRLLTTQDPWSYALGIAGVFALASQAIHGLFDFGLYLPANMLLLATICGAVCGRAAKMEGHLNSFDSPSMRRPTWWIGLPRLRPLAASACTAALFLLMLGSAHMHREAAAQAALDASAELDLQQPQPLQRLDQAIAELTRVARGHSREVDVRRRLAQLWTTRMRVALVDSMKQESETPVSDQPYWAATEPNRLYGRIQQWTARQMDSPLATFRSSAAVLENLPQAIMHLRSARSQSPLVPEVHLMLAELTVLLLKDFDNSQDLQRVRITARSQPGTLTRCGWLELQAGRIDQACATWKQSLTLAPEQFDEILQVARGSMDLAYWIDSLVPDSASWILDVAVRRFNEPVDQPIRRSLLNHAERLLHAIGPYDGPSNYYLGRIAMLRNDGNRAVTHLTRAVMLQPEETAWRYQLSIALHHAGRTREAQQHARVCLEFEPENPRYQALLRELIRDRTASKRRT